MTLSDKQARELVARAAAARERAYVPYSHFAVGAALLSADGRVFGGCNIESAAYGPTNCAERTAFFTAVAQGVRDFDAIAVVGGAEGTPPAELCPPCGVCRQVMAEFCSPQSFVIALGKGGGEYELYTLAQLLPLAFGPGNLKK